ncbi:hypothetical protein CEXT_703461 [Caerostris extrusa]|uniref:Uncharacterized protein n=1 Tax=Caerostris extrusa TaxID=172846 RepID=A0AAV4NKT6_CAEEX|nr:hypothetical protein CEXT_703461 [Caerostris extrusa]
MIPISDIGFVGHCHYAFTAYGKVPVEISLSTLRNHQSACITVDITGAPFTAKNRRANKWAFKNVSKLQFPFRGYNSVGQIRAVVETCTTKRTVDEDSTSPSKEMN